MPAIAKPRRKNCSARRTDAQLQRPSIRRSVTISTGASTSEAPLAVSARVNVNTAPKYDSGNGVRSSPSTRALRLRWLTNSSSVSQKKNADTRFFRSATQATEATLTGCRAKNAATNTETGTLTPSARSTNRTRAALIACSTICVQC